MDIFSQDWRTVLDGQAMQIWIRIMQWVWALSILWFAALLFRGGFVDLNERAKMRGASAGQRFGAHLRKPLRVLMLIFAAVFGATSVALPLWFQGAFVIVLWGQFSAGG